MNRIPIVILCGGRGIRIDASGERLSKALVRVSGEPMAIHVMKAYVRAGFRTFVLSAGLQRERLLNVLMSECGARRGSDAGVLRVRLLGENCAVRVVDSGPEAPTGQRVRIVERFVASSPYFGLTYSDTLSTQDLRRVAAFHRAHGRIGTLVSVKLPTRFKILGLRYGDDTVRGFARRPVIQNDFINGGFYFFTPRLFEPAYWGSRKRVVFEDVVLERLAAASELKAFPCEGWWQYLDAERHIPALEAIVKAAAALP